ncbi:hypothetical protein [Labrys sp. KNU-23]|uniref:hypothetical protein n=1 Tax=Labrys sp. KNU-23 TaxID=2789216 RepID=UPI00165C6351|nr:hypothetical protein [Labrys sp. KNU-23]
MRITLFGTPDSVYTRIIRLILDFKNVGHDFVMADIFSSIGVWWDGVLLLEKGR